MIGTATSHVCGNGHCSGPTGFGDNLSSLSTFSGLHSVNSKNIWLRQKLRYLITQLGRQQNRMFVCEAHLLLKQLLATHLRFINLVWILSCSNSIGRYNSGFKFISFSNSTSSVFAVPVMPDKGYRRNSSGKLSKQVSRSSLIGKFSLPQLLGADHRSTFGQP